MLALLRKHPTSVALWCIVTIGFVVAASTSSAIGAFILFPSMVSEGEVWRLMTYWLFPITFLHYAAASVALLWWGRQVEVTLGPWRYLAVCVTPNLLAGLIYLVIQRLEVTQRPLAGTHFLTTAVTVAALLMALPHIRWRSWRPWVVGALMTYYAVAMALAPLDVMIMNVVACVAAGGLFMILRTQRRAA